MSLAVYTQEEFEEALSGCNDALPDIGVHAEVTLPDNREATILVHRSGHLHTSSSNESFIILYGGKVTVTWDGGDDTQLCWMRGNTAEIEFIGPADKVEPLVERYSHFEGWTVTYKDTAVKDAADAAKSPSHYTWVGEALAASGAPDKTSSPGTLLTHSQATTRTSGTP